MYLNSFNGHIHGNLRGVQFGHSRSLCIIFSLILEPGSFEYQESGSLYLGSHIGQLELNRLVLANGLAECLSFLGVGQCQFVSSRSNS